MTDFYSQNRCVCSTRSHGPLLCAFCLSFHFKWRCLHRYRRTRPAYHAYVGSWMSSSSYYQFLTEFNLIATPSPNCVGNPGWHGTRKPMVYRVSCYSPHLNIPRSFKIVIYLILEHIYTSSINTFPWQLWTACRRRCSACGASDASDASDASGPCSQAVVLEGKYWKRRLECVTAEYKKWRVYYKDRLRRPEEMFMDEVTTRWRHALISHVQVSFISPKTHCNYNKKNVI